MIGRDTVTDSLPKNGCNRTTPRIRKDRKKNLALVLGEVGLVHSLSSSDIPVYVGSEEKNKDNPSLYSRQAVGNIIFSTYRSEKFIQELCDFGRTLDQKAVIFSDDDDAILTISKFRDRLSRYYLFSFPEKNIVSSVLDKQEFSDLTHNYDLPTPISFAISSRSELKNVACQCPFPCIVKPTYRSDWYHEDFEHLVGEYKKAYCCSDKKELFDLYDKISRINPRVVIQEYIEGEDSLHYSVNMYVDSRGKVRGHYIARKIRMYPIGAGMGSLVITLRDEEILKKSVEVVRTLKLRGLLNIQFKRDSRTGEPKLIEIHFRNSVWGYLGSSAGMNLYTYYYNDLTGRELPELQKVRPGVKYVDLSRDIFGFVQYWRKGKLSFWDWLKSYRGELVIGSFKASDPVPFLMYCWYQLLEILR